MSAVEELATYGLADAATGRSALVSVLVVVLVAAVGVLAVLTLLAGDRLAPTLALLAVGVAGGVRDRRCDRALRWLRWPIGLAVAVVGFVAARVVFAGERAEVRR